MYKKSSNINFLLIISRQEKIKNNNMRRQLLRVTYVVLTEA